ncbi:MAG: DinB family protein [Rhodothermales bacterium]
MTNTTITTMSTDPRFPIGKFSPPSNVSPDDRDRWISRIANLPDLLQEALEGLSDEQLETPYRAGGWTLRQVVHHLPDSHMNAYVRFRLSITEDTPRIKAYDEKKWAELDDAMRMAGSGVNRAFGWTATKPSTL